MEEQALQNNTYSADAYIYVRYMLQVQMYVIAAYKYILMLTQLHIYAYIHKQLYNSALLKNSD